jgi:site-specific recombinase XerD
MTDHADRSPGIVAYSPGSHSVAIGAEDLRTLAAAWLATFRSDRTREAYGSDLGRFSRWLADRGVASVLDATRTHVDMYALGLEADGYAPSTRARHLSALSSFYAYLQTDHGWPTNPAARVRRPKLPTYSPRLGLNLDTAPLVIAAAERLGPDHRAVVALCLFAGLRVSEALGVRVEDISTEAGHRVVRVTSKGGRDDLVPLSPAAVRLLADRIGDRTSGHVLAGLDRFQVRRLVAALGREAGLDGSLTVHDLRHGAATCALEAGEPIHRVQQLLRHASPVTTQRYDHARDRLDRSSAYALGHALGGAA